MCCEEEKQNELNYNPPETPPAEILRGYGTEIRKYSRPEREALFYEILTRRLPESIRPYKPSSQTRSLSFATKLLSEQPVRSNLDEAGELSQLDRWIDLQTKIYISDGEKCSPCLLKQLEHLSKTWVNRTEPNRFGLYLGLGVGAIAAGFLAWKFLRVGNGVQPQL